MSGGSKLSLTIMQDELTDEQWLVMLHQFCSSQQQIQCNPFLKPYTPIHLVP